jgi:hypothetical protein
MKNYVTVTLLFTLLLLIIGCSDAVDSDDNDSLPPPAEQELIHFWHFDVTLPNDIELINIPATFSKVGNSSTIRYESALSGYPETERNAAMERRNQPTAINYRPEGNGGLPYAEVADSMRAIQVKEPFTGDAGANTLMLDLPTTDYERVVLTFAAMDEGAVLGLRFDYSVVSGTPQWISAEMISGQIEQSLVNGEYLPIEVDFSEIASVNNNPDFKVRIRFDVLDGTRNEGDRVTFNNFALDAAPINQ